MKRNLRMAVFAFVFRLTGLCAVGWLPFAWAECSLPQFVEPALRVVTQARPAVRWAPVTGAEGYAFKLVSREPNGRLIATYESVVADARFSPQTALADERAKVTVTVSARCGGKLGPAAQTWFVVDVTAACAAPSGVNGVRQGERWAADWVAVANATGYEARLYGLADGRVLRVAGVREARVVFDGDLPASAVLAVRAQCATGYGAAAYRVVAAD